MNICNKCADQVGNIKSIKGDCQQIGGLKNVVYFADISKQMPENIVKNSDGSIASFSLGKCGQLHKLTMRPDLSFVSTPKSKTENGTVYQQTVNLFVNDLSNQAIKDAVNALENADKIMVIYETKYGAFEIAGFGKGLQGGDGQRNSGATIGEASRDEIILTGGESAVPITLDCGSKEETEAFIEVLLRPAVNFDFATINTGIGESGNSIFAIKNFGSVIQASAVGANTKFIQSLDKGNTWQNSVIGSTTGQLKTVIASENNMLYLTATKIEQVAGPDFTSLIVNTFIDLTVNEFTPSITNMYARNKKVIVVSMSTVSATTVRIGISTDLIPANIVYSNLATGLGGIGILAYPGIDLDGNYYIIVTDSTSASEIYRSTDGLNWELLAISNLFPATISPSDYNLSFVTQNLIFFQTEVALFRSTDSGITWTSVITNNVTTTSEVISTQYGLFTSRNNIVYRSNDCGVTWQVFSVLSQNLTSSLHYENAIYFGGIYQTSPNGLRVFKNYLPCIKTNC